MITTSFAQQDAFESTMIHEYRWMEWKVLSFPCSHFPAYSFIHSVRRISSSIYTSYDLSFNTYMNCHISMNFLSLFYPLTYSNSLFLSSHTFYHIPSTVTTLYCCPLCPSMKGAYLSSYTFYHIPSTTVSQWKGAYLHFVPWIVRT